MPVPQARPKLALLLAGFLLLPVSLLLSVRAGGARGDPVVAGTYGCTDARFQALRLTPGGHARLTATLYGHPVERTGTYEAAGRIVTVRIDPPAGRPPMVFTRSGETLDAVLGGRCTRR